MKKILAICTLLILSCNVEKNKNSNLPGRLGNVELQLKDDPRVDLRIIEAMKPYGLHVNAPMPPVSIDASDEDKLNYLKEAEPGYQMIFSEWFSGIEGPDDIETSYQNILGSDGNEIKLTITKPINNNSEMPAVLHLHGGGMAILTASDPNYVLWRESLASKGLIVVGVEFRNVGGQLGNHPFPAALNDCVSALKWVHEKRKDFGISKIIISGESGGGNLSIATALKAKDLGNLDYFDGVYAQCPYISNMYGSEKDKLPSLIENNAYFLNVEDMNVMASMYDGPKSRDPFAWPLHATGEMLEGLPPHVITVNELDPLRDEGLKYYRMLLKSKVNVRSKTLNGTVHAAEGIFVKYIPELFEATINDIKEFAYSL